MSQRVHGLYDLDIYLFNFIVIGYSQVPNKRPLINFSIFFSNPSDHIRFINFKEFDSLYKPLISFPFFVSTIYAQISWQNSVMFYIF